MSAASSISAISADGLIAGVGALEPISLTEMDSVAALRTRHDRKYVVDVAHAAALVDAFASDVRVLDIDGRRSARFESLYFDTGDFALHRAAVQGRRHRFKVRTRRYPGQPTPVLEVKQRSGRGETVKHRLVERAGEDGILDADDHRFIDEVVGTPGASAELVPTLTTSYRRTALLLADAEVRITLDQDLACTDWARRRVSLADVVVETKSRDGRSPIDRWLWANGARPEPISKYCTSLAVLHPALPSNKWHRTIERHFS